MKLLKICAFLLVGFALGVLASYLTYVSARARIANRTERTVDVVIAARDIPVGTLLSAADLRLAKVPISLVPPGASENLSWWIGHKIVLPIDKGEFILPNKIEGEYSGAVRLTKPPSQPVARVGPSKARSAQLEAYEDSFRVQCLAADGTPDCRHIHDGQRRQLEQRLEEMKKQLCGDRCPEVIPIPPEHPQQHSLKKASAL